MPKRILMVDDSATVLSFEKLMFRNEDYELITASNGVEALKIVHATRPDLILLDVVMPQMDGLECCRALKKDAATKAIPVIMVTTKGDQSMITEAYAAGCDDFITKPIARTELLQKVTGHLERAGRLAMDGQREKRAYRRVPMELDASVTVQSYTHTATVANLSMGGALLVNAGDLPVGGGVRLAFRLPSGLPVHVNGKVVRRDGKQGYGVQFFELDDVTREVLDDHLMRFGPTPGIDARVSVKYNLETRGNRLVITLSGFLEKNDCVELKAQMERVAQRLTANTELIIDAVNFVCCAPDGLRDFSTWLSAFAGTALIGGLVGPRSVGVLQIRRAIRDAHIADAFMGFESVDEASDTFGRLNATSRPLS